MDSYGNFSRDHESHITFGFKEYFYVTFRTKKRGNLKNNLKDHWGHKTWGFQELKDFQGQET